MAPYPSLLDGFAQQGHHVLAFHAAALEPLCPGDEDALRRDSKNQSSAGSTHFRVPKSPDPAPGRTDGQRGRWSSPPVISCEPLHQQRFPHPGLWPRARESLAPSCQERDLGGWVHGALEQNQLQCMQRIHGSACYGMHLAAPPAQAPGLSPFGDSRAITVAQKKGGGIDRIGNLRQQIFQPNCRGCFGKRQTNSRPLYGWGNRGTECNELGATVEPTLPPSATCPFYSPRCPPRGKQPSFLIATTTSPLQRSCPAAGAAWSCLDPTPDCGEGGKNSPREQETAARDERSRATCLGARSEVAGADVMLGTSVLCSARGCCCFAEHRLRGGDGCHDELSIIRPLPEPCASQSTKV